MPKTLFERMSEAQAMTASLPTAPIGDELVERVKRLLPVSWDNETDGHGEATHAVLTFGEHQTQAITMQPDDWMVLNELPDAITGLHDRIEKLEQEIRRKNAVFRRRRTALASDGGEG